MFRRAPDRVTPLMIGAGAAAGATAVAWSVLRVVRTRRDAHRVEGELDALEDAAVEALRRDPVTGSCPIDVAAPSPGIIELSGRVPNRETGQRAARLLHAVPGVRTVVNRLAQGAAEAQIEHNRVRRERGDPYTLDRHWYGVRVGTGRRRQSPLTDPDRPDDTVKRRTRALEPSAADIAEAASQVAPPDRRSRDGG
jgi:hypothetical protein